MMLGDLRHHLEDLSRGVDRRPVDVELGSELRAKAGKQGLSANPQGCCEGEANELAQRLQVTVRFPDAGFLIKSANSREGSGLEAPDALC